MITNITRVHALVDQLLQRLSQVVGKHVKVKTRREIAPTVLLGFCVLNGLAYEVDKEGHEGESVAIGNFMTGCMTRHDRVSTMFYTLDIHTLT